MMFWLSRSMEWHRCYKSHFSILPFPLLMTNGWRTHRGALSIITGWATSQTGENWWDSSNETGLSFPLKSCIDQCRRHRLRLLRSCDPFNSKTTLLAWYSQFDSPFIFIHYGYALFWCLIHACTKPIALSIDKTVENEWTGICTTNGKFNLWMYLSKWND